MIIIIIRLQTYCEISDNNLIKTHNGTVKNRQFTAFE